MITNNRHTAPSPCLDVLRDWINGGMPKVIKPAQNSSRQAPDFEPSQLEPFSDYPALKTMFQNDIEPCSARQRNIPILQKSNEPIVMDALVRQVQNHLKQSRKGLDTLPYFYPNEQDKFSIDNFESVLHNLTVSRTTRKQADKLSEEQVNLLSQKYAWDRSVFEAAYRDHIELDMEMKQICRELSSNLQKSLDQHMKFIDEL